MEIRLRKEKREMRGGRGGGRGRGRGGRGSVTQDLIRDNLEDLGEDAYQVLDDRVPPPLYPNVPLVVPSSLSEDELFCVQKMREITDRIRKSPYYFCRTVEQSDIKRYSDKYRRVEKEISLLDCINTSTEDATRYIPHELLDGSALGGRSLNDGDANKKKRGEDNLFQKLEQAEADGKQGGPKKDEEGSDKEGELEEEDQEEDDDYAVDYYASDDDGGGGDGDDREATF